MAKKCGVRRKKSVEFPARSVSRDGARANFSAWSKWRKTPVQNTMKRD
jgi:hypothetical protein